MPDNEQYYVRVLNSELDNIQEESQRSEILNFIRQESLHGVAHRKYWKEFERGGIDVSGYIKFADVLLYRILEPCQPRWLKLSIVAAIEHINASISNSFLKRGLLRPSEPELRRMFEWHFAEEIEHKAVTHDALEILYPGYIKRITGGVLAYCVFTLLIFVGTLFLLARQKVLFRRQNITDCWSFLVSERVLFDFAADFLRYLRSSFTPWSVDDKYLADKALREHSVLNISDTDEILLSEVKVANG